MFYNKITKKENNKYGQKIKKIKKLRRKNHVKKQKGNNPNRISSNDSSTFDTSRDKHKLNCR